MKLQYIAVQTGGKLQASEATMSEAMELMNRIWIFICGHRHHVLNKFHSACKVSNAHRPYNDLSRDYGVFTILNFFSPWDNHAPYIEILKRELNLEIEGLPAKEKQNEDPHSWT